MARSPRKCSVCKAEIEFDINDFHNIARLKDRYYHSNCLIELATKRIKNPKHAECWDYALEHLDACEKEAKEVLTYTYWQDKLNDHLIRHYDVVLPQRFWNVIADLTNGEFKGRKCKPIPMQDICETWIWAQKKLNEINRFNKMKKNGPNTDAERVNYDLSIVAGHIGDYKKAKAKEKAMEAERELKAKENINIDYSKVQAKKESSGLGDISDLIDDLI